MNRAMAVLAIGLLLATVVGCSGNRSESGSCWFGDTNWGSREKPYGWQEEERPRLTGGDPKENQWFSGLKGLFNPMTYDPAILAAVHDLNDGKLAWTRLNAACNLGEMNADVNIAIEALENGCKDGSMDVRMASARALMQIGSANALHHLRECQEKGYVPTDCAAYDRWEQQLRERGVPCPKRTVCPPPCPPPAAAPCPAPTAAPCPPAPAAPCPPASPCPPAATCPPAGPCPP